jgi:hypothetical protein
MEDTIRVLSFLGKFSTSSVASDVITYLNSRIVESRVPDQGSPQELDSDNIRYKADIPVVNVRECQLGTSNGKSYWDQIDKESTDLTGTDSSMFLIRFPDEGIFKESDKTKVESSPIKND